jgi:hypothetical protein
VKKQSNNIIKSRIAKEVLNDRLRGVDRVLIFRFFKLLHGRFWGFGSLIAISLGALIGYSIRPDLLGLNTPLSRLGTDVRTSPFFAGSMFLSAYCLWRWRTYLRLTVRNSKPLLPLISLTILGLYLVALMPVTWKPWPYRIHHFGVVLAGISMCLTVMLDSILSKNKHSKHQGAWRAIKIFALLLIMTGGAIVILSTENIAKLHLILVGEAVMFFGYGVWISLKIYLGVGKTSAIGKIVKRLLK